MIFVLFLYYLLYFQSGLNINAPISMQTFPLKVAEKFRAKSRRDAKINDFRRPFYTYRPVADQTLS